MILHKLTVAGVVIGVERVALMRVELQAEALVYMCIVTNETIQILHCCSSGVKVEDDLFANFIGE